MKKYFFCCIVCLMTAVCFAGCSKAEKVETDEEIRIPNEEDVEALGEAADLYEAVAEENQKEKGELVISEDGIFQVSIPAGWGLSKNKIDDTMLFEIQGGTEDQYIGILVIEKGDYVTIEASVYVDKYVQNAQVQYENAVIGEVTTVNLTDSSDSVDIGSENAPMAYTMKISGTIDEVSYINHVYVVDYEEEIVVFTASTYPENEMAVVEDLESVVKSFERAEEMEEA